MKKKEKKTHFSIEVFVFFTILFWLLFWLCISKMNCIACEGAPITFQIIQKWTRIEKDLPKCSVIGRQSMMGQYILHMIRVTTKKGCEFNQKRCELKNFLIIMLIGLVCC